MVRRQTYDREVPATTTLGKSFTPTCLDADTLRSCTESSNWIPFTFAADTGPGSVNIAGRTAQTVKCSVTQNSRDVTGHVVPRARWLARSYK